MTETLWEDRLRDADIIGQDIASSPHFHAMPGMRLESPDGWVRLAERDCLRWQGRPDMLDAATVGCLAQIAWSIVQRAKESAALRQEMFAPTTFCADDIGTIEVPNCVWAYDRFISCVMIDGLTSIEAIRQLRSVFTEASR